MNVLTDPFTPASFPDLFTWMWVAGIVIAIGAIVVYNLAQRRYRRYPELLALHDLVLFPLYSGADRVMRRLAGGAINYVRVPAALSLLMLVVFFGTIAERGERAYSSVSGLTSAWPIASASPEVISASSYAGSGHTAPGGITIAIRLA